MHPRILTTRASKENDLSATDPRISTNATNLNGNPGNMGQLCYLELPVTVVYNDPCTAVLALTKNGIDNDDALRPVRSPSITWVKRPNDRSVTMLDLRVRFCSQNDDRHH